MCLDKPRSDSSIPLCSPTKKCKMQVHLTERGSSAKKSVGRGTDMEMQNLKLYLENRCIIEENERLRRRALVLYQENRDLRSKLENNSSVPDDNI